MLALPRALGGYWHQACHADLRFARYNRPRAQTASDRDLRPRRRALNSGSVCPWSARRSYRRRWASPLASGTIQITTRKRKNSSYRHRAAAATAGSGCVCMNLCTTSTPLDPRSRHLNCRSTSLGSTSPATSLHSESWITGGIRISRVCIAFACMDIHQRRICLLGRGRRGCSSGSEVNSI